MFRVDVKVEPIKSNSKFIEFILRSWKKKKVIDKHLSIRSNKCFKDLIDYIYTIESELKGKFILKCGNVRIGGKNARLHQKLSNSLIWSSDDSGLRIIKVITPDKFPANPAKNRNSDENPIYTVEFLRLLEGKEPTNLHGNCPFNEKRIGRHDNHPANLFMMKTPYGTVLCNIKSAYEALSGDTTRIVDPTKRIKVTLTINEKPFQIPSVEKNSCNLRNIIRSFDDTSVEDRELKLYTIDTIQQESTKKFLSRVFLGS